MDTSSDLDQLRRFYRAVADEYEDHAIDVPGHAELMAAVDAFRPTGDVLELACGTGVWTEHLLRTAQRVTAVDAAPEMLARAKAPRCCVGAVRRGGSVLMAARRQV